MMRKNCVLSYLGPAVTFLIPYGSCAERYIYVNTFSFFPSPFSAQVMPIVC
jgi:hypothetical protein